MLDKTHKKASNDIMNISGIFDVACNEKDASLIYLPVPWDVTTSYKKGTAHAPSAILNASAQVDLFDTEVRDPYKAGLFLLPEREEIHAWNNEANKYISNIDSVNQLCGNLNELVYNRTRRILEEKKFPGIIGGEHSVIFGAIKAAARKHESFGILQFDAHMDCRKAYQGFIWSHASIMHNIIETIPQVNKLVQVGIRDFCEEELAFSQSYRNRIKTFFDASLFSRKSRQESWHSIAEDIVSALPEKIWISFDIDALDPKLCPNTGTPVPGGLEFNEAVYILSTLVRANKKIIGFDLCEVSPDLSDSENEWDANVGSRILYKLSAWLLASQGLCEKITTSEIHPG